MALDGGDRLPDREGRGASAEGIAPSQYFATTAVERGINDAVGPGPRGSQIDIENFTFGNILGHGIFIGIDPSTDGVAAGITMNNIVSQVQDGYGVGVPLAIDGNALFMTFSNMNFQPRSDGFPASILFTQTNYAGNGHADILFNNIFTLWHHIVIDSPAGQNTRAGNQVLRANGLLVERRTRSERNERVDSPGYRPFERSRRSAILGCGPGGRIDLKHAERRRLEQDAAFLHRAESGQVRRRGSAGGVM